MTTMIVISANFLCFIFFIFMAYFVLSKKVLTGEKYLFALLLAVAWYAFCAAMVPLRPVIAWKMFWNALLYFGSGAAGPLWLILCLIYAGYGERLTPRTLAAIFLVPVLTVALKCTDGFHHLIYGDIHLETRSGLVRLAFSKGPWYYVWMLYTGLAFICGIAVTGKVRFQSLRTNRLPSSFMVLSGVAPLLVVVLYSLFRNMFPFDISSFGFLISTSLLMVGLLRFDLLSAHPVTWKDIFETYGLALIVIDPKGRLMDCNGEGARILSARLPTLRNLGWEGIVEAFPEVRDLPISRDGAVFDTVVSRGNLERRAALQVLHLRDSAGKPKGKTITLNWKGDWASPRSIDLQKDRQEIGLIRRYLAEGKRYLDPDLSLTGVASKVGMDRNRISFLLNTYERKNFRDFVNSYRIEEAKAILRKKRGNILELAFEVGFNSKSAFYRSFSSHVGMTPRRYMDSAGEESQEA